MKTTKNTTQSKWLFIPDHYYKKLIIGGSGSGKTNTLLNLIKQENDIDKIYWYAKYLSEPLIKQWKNGGIKHLKDSNVFIECSNTMDDVYENIDGYNPNRQRKILLNLITWLQTLWQNKNSYHN